MSRLSLGLICGVVFGALAVLLMLPLPFPDKRTALAAAFLDRFAIGFVICVAEVPGSAWAVGMGFGLPILGVGAVDGAILGSVVSHFTG